MHHHHEVVLVGASVGLPPSLQRQLQLTGARQAECLTDDQSATHVGLLHGQDTEDGNLSEVLCGERKIIENVGHNGLSSFP